MSDVRDAATDQPLPRPGRVLVHEHAIVWLSRRGLRGGVLEYLSQALRDRLALGVRKYGLPLQSGNGRDALADATDEVLDALVYLHQMELEGEPGMRPLLGHCTELAVGLARRRIARDVSES